VRYSTRGKIYQEGSYRKNRRKKSFEGRHLSTDNWEICVCIIRPAGESRLSLVLSSFMSMCACPICSREKKNTPGREIGRERMNELLLLAPLYLEVNNLRIFEPFLFYFCPRPIFVQHEDRSKKKERKTLQIFTFFLGTGEWHSIERGAGWLDCQLPSSFALLVPTAIWLLPRYITRLFFFTSCGCSLSPSFSFSPPVSFRPENGPHSLPDTFFYSKRWLCSLTIKQVYQFSIF
jgi:hypothetical protein